MFVIRCFNCYLLYSFYYHYYLLYLVNLNIAHCFRAVFNINLITDHLVLVQILVNLVPLILISERENVKLREGKLADIAPTLLELMGLEKPKEMTGNSLIEK